MVCVNGIIVCVLVCVCVSRGGVILGVGDVWYVVSVFSIVSNISFCCSGCIIVFLIVVNWLYWFWLLFWL